MKTKYYIILLFIIIGSNVFCLNKGSGDFLHPISITKISITKATINIDYDFQQSEWIVNVIYEFENPEDITTQKVEFISKSDYFDDFTGSLKQFEIIANGVNSEIKNRLQVQQDSSILEYYYAEINFIKGINHVINNFRLPGFDTGMPNLKGFFFNVTSGNNWQGTIKEVLVEIKFTLPILLDNYSSFLSFEGKYRNDTFRYDHEKVISIENGKLYYRSRNSIPKENIFVQFYSRGYVMLQERFGESISLYDITYQKIANEELKKLSKDVLKILRNSIYAWYGYKFKDPYLDEYFKKKCWYWPTEKDDIQLNNTEKQNVESIRKIEMEN